MSLEQRLGALEQSNHRWKLLTCGLLVTIAASVTMGAGDADRPVDVLRAQRFVLVNERGNTIGYFGSQGGAAVLTLHPTDESTSVSLRADKAGTYILATKGWPRGNPERRIDGLIAPGRQ